MGARVEGKRKRKGKKVAVTSKFNGKRKLSRMGKKIRKGMMGPNTDFKTRSYVLKKLQLSLKDFRRLCILKGIYPRVPSKAPKGADKIYYDIKDITYLSHEPLLAKFREFKTFMKKIRKAAGRNQISEARRKDRLKPVMVLDHLVKERYPRFIDALRDLDDALCMLHLFASLPSSGRVTSEHTLTCANLCRHWQYYVAKSKSLKKVFVSVKGVYFQAEVMGEAITWLVPHQFTQVIPREVDLRVMLTFLEFYEVFIKFTLYKLYNLVGLNYPPVIDPALNDAGCCLLAVKVSHNADVAGSSGAENAVVAALPDTHTDSSSLIVNKKAIASAKDVQALSEKLSSMKEDANEDDDDEEEEDDDDENVPIAGPLSEAFAVIEGADEDAFGENEEEKRTFQSSAEAEITSSSRLFHGLKFFINREVPLDWLQLCIISFGGKVGWDSPLSPYKSDDAGITHHIIDRPMQGNSVLSREYIQPQWVFDCINAEFLLPVAAYRPGAVLPPHLSPFVNDNKEGYVPSYKQQIEDLKAEAGIVPGSRSSKEKEELDDVEGEDADEEDEYADEVRAERSGKHSTTSGGNDEKEDSDNDNSDAEEEETAAVNKYKTNNAAASKKGPKAVVFTPAQQSEKDEEAAMNEGMMNKKTKRLYDRMQHGISKKRNYVESLHDKRRSIEEQPRKK